MAGRFGAVRVGGWALMSARHRPAPTPRVEGRPRAARDPRPSLYRRLLLTGSPETTSADATSVEATSGDAVATDAAALASDAAALATDAAALATDAAALTTAAPSLDEQLAQRLDTFLGIAERL